MVVVVSFDLTAQRRNEIGDFFVCSLNSFIIFSFQLFRKREQEAFFQFPFLGLPHNNQEERGDAVGLGWGW